MSGFSFSNLVAAVRSFLALVRNPNDLKNFRAVEVRLLALASERDRERVVASYWRSPELRPMLEGRYFGPRHEPEVMRHLPEDTFGHAYARFMIDNGLSVDYLPHESAESDLMYFRERMLQMHDIWHVVLGAAPDVEGELEVIGFSIGQLERTLRRELAVLFFYLMTVAYLAHTAWKSPGRFVHAWRRFRSGRRTGHQTQPFFAVRWEELWELPVRTVRAACLRPGALPGPSLPPATMPPATAPRVVA